MIERLLPWRGRRPPPGRRWRYCLGLSLLLHGALLWLPARGLRERGASGAPVPVMTLTLKSPRATLPVAAPSPATPVASSAVRGDARRPRAMPRALAVSAVPSAPPAASEAQTTADAPPQRLDVDALRAQARDRSWRARSSASVSPSFSNVSSRRSASPPT